MKRILSRMRRCLDDYDMISPGDHVAVGVSGGKDSLVTLAALARLSKFYDKPFTVSALSLDLGMPGMDFQPLADFCAQIDVPLTIVKSEIYSIIFEVRKEKNPCSMCAKMRRGALHAALEERGITKIALGHHYDDAIETFFLSLFYEGRISCFQPVTYLDRTDVTQIRPLLYCGEQLVRTVAAKEQLPIIHNTCPADGYTKRQEIKDLVKELEGRYPDLKQRVFGGMQRHPLLGWEPNDYRRHPLPEED
jgi:Predicted ATPase of the PP-loop superfamily implicated in cell cycle control